MHPFPLADLNSFRRNSRSSGNSAHCYSLDPKYDLHFAAIQIIVSPSHSLSVCGVTEFEESGAKPSRFRSPRVVSGGRRFLARECQSTLIPFIFIDARACVFFIFNNSQLLRRHEPIVTRSSRSARGKKCEKIHRNFSTMGTDVSNL